MTDKYLCIHGHFYQPPRENPWLGVIEYQGSAQPYHDWNERITRECYGPNTRARVHGQGGRIQTLINNYSYMSFDFGPTLLSWLEKAHPWIYAQILAADKASQARYEGHGNAQAQVYNHIIMPLANRRDKLTQIRWGLADFKHRFGRPSEGMWLAETAVDTETLNLMAQEGVKFTILSPTQAQSVRPLAGQARSSRHHSHSGEKASWKDVSGGQIDPTQPYRVSFDDSGNRFIDVFFYDGPISRAVAYEKLLSSGKDFLERIENAFGQGHDGPKLVGVTTDGESYGHHFKFGDLALSWIFHQVNQSGRIKLTNYAAFLERFPPRNEVKIIENSAWSCFHGVDRWQADCGCNVTHTPGWNQAWRAPLREGLNWLAGELAAIFEEQGTRLFMDPWEARDDYITVLLNPSDRLREQFLRRHALRPLDPEKKIQAFQLMESQRMSMYMFTSCGWFFDEISGLEATQVLKYALRGLELMQAWADKDLEAGLIEFLVKAKSNDPDYGHGGQVYDSLVKPSWIDPSWATGHYGLAALLDAFPQDTGIFSEVVRPTRQLHLNGRGLKAVLGQTLIAEKGTGREFKRAFLALDCKDGDLRCLVGQAVPSFNLDRLSKKLRPILTKSDWKIAEEIFSRHLTEARTYRLEDLTLDGRKDLIQGLARGLEHRITAAILDQDGALQRLVSLLQETGEPAPKIVGNILPLLLPDQVNKLMVTDQAENTIDFSAPRGLAAQARLWEISLDDLPIREKAQGLLSFQMKRLAKTPDLATMKTVISLLNLFQELTLELDLWECQNIFHDLYNDPEFIQALSPHMSATFRELGHQAGFLIGGE